MGARGRGCEVGAGWRRDRRVLEVSLRGCCSPRPCWLRSGRGCNHGWVWLGWGCNHRRVWLGRGCILGMWILQLADMNRWFRSPLLSEAGLALSSERPRLATVSHRPRLRPVITLKLSLYLIVVFFLLDVFLPHLGPAASRLRRLGRLGGLGGVRVGLLRPRSLGRRGEILGRTPSLVVNGFPGYSSTSLRVVWLDIDCEWLLVRVGRG